jgi:lysylphosphatidylglycerol synthetase-like protein (DUF2156 family)
MKVLSALAADAQQSVRRLIICACLAFAAVLSGAIGLGFATYALFVGVRLQYGAIAAAAVLAAFYLIVAGIFFLLYRRASRAASREAAKRLNAAAQAASAPQAAAVTMGLELAKQLTPLQLALLAALSGFVAGRRL